MLHVYISLLRVEGVCENTKKLNESGRQQVGRGPVRRRSKHAKLYSDPLQKEREPLRALGIHQAGGGGGGGGSEGCLEPGGHLEVETKSQPKETENR